jgi:hypothetical protein
MSVRGTDDRGEAGVEVGGVGEAVIEQDIMNASAALTSGDE